jgi:hypothetical protein
MVVKWCLDLCCGGVTRDFRSISGVKRSVSCSEELGVQVDSKQSV